MSIQRLPNWQIPNINSSVDDPESLKEVIEWLRIHHIEHDEESANVALDFEKLVVDTIYPTNVESTNVTTTNITVTTSITLSGTTASRLLATDVSNVAVSTDLLAWVAGTTNRVSVADDLDGTITLSLPQDIHASASPTFVTAKLSGLTDGFVPYHVADATGLANSNIFYDGTNVGIGVDAATRFEIGSTDASNRLSLYHDNTNGYFKWDDGSLILQTDEGTNTATYLELKPKGTSEISSVSLYDTDGKRLELITAADRSYVRSVGGVLGINDDAANNVSCFESATTGENPLLNVYGYITTGTAARYSSLKMDDTNDEFLIQSENNANHEGITIDLTETNQKFRLRQNSDIASWTLDGSDLVQKWSDGQFVLQTDEGTDTVTVLHLKPKGNANASFYLGDRDGSNFADFSQSESATYISSANNDVFRINYSNNKDVTFFEEAAVVLDGTSSAVNRVEAKAPVLALYVRVASVCGSSEPDADSNNPTKHVVSVVVASTVTVEANVAVEALPANAPVNVVVAKFAVPALYVSPPSVFIALLTPVASSNIAGKQVVSVVSATVIEATVVAPTSLIVTSPLIARLYHLPAVASYIAI